MFSRQNFLLIATLTLLNAASIFAGQHWAVVVAGSNGWYNYRHQADTCHAYQILHKNGIPDSNIVVMMYDDIAQNTQNPTKGVVINHPNGQDVYHDVPHDYVGKDVTPENFINVLLGKQDAMKGIGSGKVINSGPDDNIFVFYTDHGAVGLVAFPTGVLYAKDLNKTLTQMYNEKKYKEMVIYIEACESGSMLETLPSNVNIYGTTASNAEESSYACYYDATRGTYLGDLYSVNWMEDSDAEDISKETLTTQFETTKARTNLSHVMQYGDLSLGQQHHVAEFQGEAASGKAGKFGFFRTRLDQSLKRDAVSTVDVRTSILSKRLAVLADNSAEKLAVQREYDATIQQRDFIFSTMETIAARAFQINGDFEKVISKHMKLTQHDCYISATQYIHDKCFDLQNEYVLHKLFIVANLCEIGIKDYTIHNAVDVVCGATGRQSFEY